MRAIVGRMRRKRGRWLKGMQPLVDLWIGGPGADGRGLDAANGGYDPAPGLQIVSPSGSTPSSSARFLIRDAGGGWRDKRPGVLAGIGGRVWTGDGWTYNGAKEVTFLGPLPALSTHGVTDTVRRYPGGSGYTVQDAPGGIVQPYSQRVDVNEGEFGGGLGVAPTEIISSVGVDDQIYWHGIVETSTPQLFAPAFGAYSDGFFDGIKALPQPLSQEQSGQDQNFIWQVRHRGTGPNGGLVVEYWVSQRITQAKSSVGLSAYLVRGHETSSARTLYIHQASAHRVPWLSNGERYGFPACILVAAGAQASLIAETVKLPFSKPMSIGAVFAVPLHDAPRRFQRVIGLDYSYHDLIVVHRPYDNPLTRLMMHNSYGAQQQFHVVANSDPMCVVSVCSVDDTKVYVDGDIKLTTYAVHNDAAYWHIGRPDSWPCLDIRRILAWPRILNASEVMAVYRSVVAAEALL